MGIVAGTVHRSCGGRFYRTLIGGKPGVKCNMCGFTKQAGTMIDRGVRVPVPWEQTEREANRR